MERWGIALVFLAGALMAQPPSEYRIVPAEGTRFALEVHKTGLMSGKKHIFVYPEYAGKLLHSAGEPEKSKVTLSIEAASAKCEDDWVKPGQLADIEKYALEDMMAAGEHPRILFASTAVIPKGEGAFEVRGTLTIRGRAEPCVLAVSLTPDGDRLRFTGKGVVNLKDYSIKPRRALPGVIGTKNEMDVSFELIAQPAPQP